MLPPFPFPLEQISCSAPVFDVCFHPARQILATALVSGEVEVHELPTADEVSAHLEAQHAHRIRQRQIERERKRRERAERREAKRRLQAEKLGEKPQAGGDGETAEGAEESGSDAEATTKTENGGQAEAECEEGDSSFSDASSSEDDSSDEEDMKRKFLNDDLKTVDTKVMTMKKHKRGCRAVRFSADGSRLFSASTDGRCIISDAERGTTLWRNPKQRDAVNTLCILTPHIFAAGDDGGTVTLWDDRQETAAGRLKDHDDFVSDLTAAWISPCEAPANPHGRRRKKRSAEAPDDAEGTSQGMPTHLLATGGDMLAVFDLRKKTLLARSDPLEEDLHCVQVMRDGKKAVCGCQDGTISIFSWGDFGDLNDRLTGHPQSIDSMVKLDENTLITGCADGCIRMVTLLPNQILGILGEHMTGHTAIERLALSGDKTLLASCSYDSTVCIYQLERGKQIEAQRSDGSQRPTKKTKQKKVVDLRKDRDFFDDL
ncbi:WD domain, G-beta repeat-containing protein [Toxoplasma gondii VAND]|uniref:WD domain, G-beta repeat-containing protein n=1 Tax=Toxoplasma gondii VAND TaxID=933077 RepID=A0A086PWV8_TOXGO|nr:WD domain, G-beta repeat-containing protein [Toxoplasma gondii VAND]